MKNRLKVAVVGLEKNIEHPSSIPFTNLYNLVGMNTGNLMFTNAVYRQIDADLDKVGFVFNPDHVNKDYDFLIIPAANWINEKSDWTWLVDLLERIEIPVVPIGIGLQADSEVLSEVSVSPSCMELARVLSKKSKFLSVRGEFTAAWFRSIGIKNVVVTGCPSLYMKIPSADSQEKDRLGTVVQSTRYYITSEFCESPGVNRELFRLSAKLDLPIIFQSEPEEMCYLVNGQFGQSGEWEAKCHALSKSYGLDTKEQLEKHLKRNGNVFFDLSDWSNFLRRHSFLIGTRLHGVILALNSGVPACLVTHDSRTSELATYAGIPSIDAQEVNEIKTPDDLTRIRASISLDTYVWKRRHNAFLYTGFLNNCGLPVNHEGIFV